MAVALELKKVSKVFQKDREIVRAVDDVSMTVAPGEMVTFLGPSGCGKTTTLRMVAGFEIPSAGVISIDGQDITNVPVNRRDIGFVFQNYALFPHMSVFENVAYGLRVKGDRGEEVRRKVREGLDLVGLGKAEKRFPNQLSGGEQQRVALARVLVLQPRVLLMDEPLSNLDAKLRIHMRTEIRRIQKHLDVTCLYVTHDQGEALTMSDRIPQQELAATARTAARPHGSLKRVIAKKIKYAPSMNTSP
jgi:iron(III) transport system ATP-binding protein